MARTVRTAPERGKHAQARGTTVGARSGEPAPVGDRRRPLASEVARLHPKAPVCHQFDMEHSTRWSSARFLRALLWVALPQTAFAQVAPPAVRPEAPSAAGSSPRLVSPLVPRNDVPGLPNFAQIAPGLYRSAQPTALGMRSAQALGIKTIVNLRAFHSDRDELAGTGLRYFHVRVHAWHPEVEDIVAFLAVALNPVNQPVLVHCEHGADRTGMMVAAYRRVEQGWTVDEALAELPRFGFHEVWVTIRTLLGGLDPDALRARVRALPPPDVRLVP